MPICSKLVIAVLLLLAGVPAHAQWHEASSKHFIIYSIQSSIPAASVLSRCAG